MTMTAVCLQFFTQKKNYIIMIVGVIANIEYNDIKKNRVKIAVSNVFSSNDDIMRYGRFSHFFWSSPKGRRLRNYENDSIDSHEGI